MPRRIQRRLRGGGFSFGGRWKKRRRRIEAEILILELGEGSGEFRQLAVGRLALEVDHLEDFA